MTAILTRKTRTELERFTVGKRYGGKDDTDFRIIKASRPRRDGDRWTVEIEAEHDPLWDTSEEETLP